MLNSKRSAKVGGGGGIVFMGQMEKRGVVSRPCLIGSELRKEVLERGREISQMEVLRVLIAFREEREAYWEVSETVPVAPFGRSVCRRQRKRKLIMDGFFFIFTASFCGMVVLRKPHIFDYWKFKK